MGTEKTLYFSRSYSMEYKRVKSVDVGGYAMGIFGTFAIDMNYKRVVWDLAVLEILFFPVASSLFKSSSTPE